MRHFFFSLVFSVILFSGWLLVGADLFSEEGLLSSEGSQSAGRVSGEEVSLPIGEYPVFRERRDVTAEFRPVRREGPGRFAVPTAHSAVLLDVATGMSLYEQDADERRAIASITKLFTAMIVVERVDNLEEAVIIDEEIVYSEGTRVGCPRTGYCIGERLHVGERISVRNLLRAALMNSCNDAALALAKHVGGTKEGFTAIMNERAKGLGLENSHFCTPSGLELDDPVAESGCYSSARDIAKVAAYALRYDEIWEIMRTSKTDISSVDGKYVHEIFNTNELLGQYPNLVGTKTGFTPRAGYSLLAVAGDPERGKHRIVAVVLDDYYRWQSIQDMFSWGFSAYEWL